MSDAHRVGQAPPGRQQTLPEPLEGGPFEARRRAVALEPVEAVVGEQDEVEEGEVRPEVAGGDFAQGVGLLELADDEFGLRAVVVEPPERQRLQGQVGDKGLVMEATQLEQVELPGRLLRDRSPDHDEPTRPRPALGLVEELRRGDLARDPVIPQRAEPPLDRPGEARHHHVLRAAGLQRLDDLVIEEGGIGPDAHLPDLHWQLGPRLGQQRERDRRYVGVAWMEAGGPHVPCRPLEAKQGQVRGAAPLLRIEADGSLLLAAVDGEHRRVEIEDHPRLGGHLGAERCAVPVVQPHEAGEPYAAAEAMQEPAERGCLRVAGEPHQVLEHAIAAQGLRRLDPTEAEDQRVEQRHEHLADPVTVVALGELDVPLQGGPHPESLEKSLDEEQPAEVRQPGGSEDNAEFPRSSGHFREPSFLMRLNGDQYCRSLYRSSWLQARG
jgi:hypothetical protein